MNITTEYVKAILAKSFRKSKEIECLLQPSTENATFYIIDNVSRKE